MMFVSNIRAVFLKKFNRLRVLFPCHGTYEYHNTGIVLDPQLIKQAREWASSFSSQGPRCCQGKLLLGYDSAFCPPLSDMITPPVRQPHHCQQYRSTHLQNSFFPITVAFYITSATYTPQLHRPPILPTVISNFLGCSNAITFN